MKHTSKALILMVLLWSTTLLAKSWEMQPTPLATRWATSVSPTNVWREHPRPQMVRQEWETLNGLWEYSITAKGASVPAQYSGYILVPYPIESALSGVKKRLAPDQLLWYRRSFHVELSRSQERVLLHFGAVDFEATVYLNDKLLGMHRGGYQSFSFDITDSLETGENEIVVKVFDPTEQGPNPHGKQNLNANWMTYSPSSGIWQTVWIERVPQTYIESLKLTPNIDRDELRVDVKLNGQGKGYSVEATALNGKSIVDQKTVDGFTVLKIAHPRMWSPDDPYLYDLQVRLLKDGRVVDAVTSYFGMRKIEVKQDVAGHARIYLNNRAIYNLAVVDQGYWPEGLYTAPNDAALSFDVQAAKALGFNTIRKHLKIEPQRWYYHCDRLGVMVWQDMPVSKNDTPEARAQFEMEVRGNMEQLHNSPSITSWVLFNEGWGAYDQERLAREMKRIDPSRVLNGHSGPMDQLRAALRARAADPKLLLGSLGGARGPLDDFQDSQFEAPDDWMSGDVSDLHHYPGPRMLDVRPNMASITGEHGSFGVYIEGHVWNELALFGVGVGVGAAGLSPQQMLKEYSNSIENLQLLKSKGLSGSGYFETFDVEDEHQGFITYDREVAKVPVAEIERLNAKLVPRARNYAQAINGFTVTDADATPDAERYGRLLSEFADGRMDRRFLRRLALMALHQKNQVRATEVGNALITSARQPYTQEAWQEIILFTRTPKDLGFDLLRTQTEAANAALGAQMAQKRVLSVILRESVSPYFQEKHREKSWQQLEQSMAAQYGVLGSEAVYGAWMMDALLKKDWANFGLLYTKYYETAIPRSYVPAHSMSYQVLQNVNDVKALETALRVMEWQMDAPQEFPVFGRYDPTKLDTYASLLFKLCRDSEAIDWQRRAVTLSDRRDPDMVKNLEHMRSKVGRRCEATG